ncbi:hypothetical protein GALMADRAFT_148657 [Galerina marginata CBS 339.88]|uniref:Reverse transcriptase zinc-binding domain-containing protein n=1 Tax=Galerina marginata (strain CBS 339.88) TaxID=685588 RepID=A0A067SCN7_GALM3|nr:hypothetical protein GALMADRAFT_148657 [Galerina marginata CBS 339.88]
MKVGPGLLRIASSRPTEEAVSNSEMAVVKPKPILPSTRKGGPYIRESGADAASFARMCMNHAPIGLYYNRFNIDEPHGCSQCGAPRETRSHILSYCPKYERNSPTDRLHGLLMFLLDNPQAFSFTRQAAAPQGIG